MYVYVSVCDSVLLLYWFIDLDSPASRRMAVHAVVVAVEKFMMLGGGVGGM